MSRWGASLQGSSRGSCTRQGVEALLSVTDSTAVSDCCFAFTGVTRQVAPQSSKVPAVPLQTQVCGAHSRSRGARQNWVFIPTPSLCVKIPSSLSGCSDDGQAQNHPERGDSITENKEHFHPGCLCNLPEFPPMCPRYRHKMLIIGPLGTGLTANKGGASGMVGIEHGWSWQCPCVRLGRKLRQPGLGSRPLLSVQQQNLPMENIFMGRKMGVSGIRGAPAACISGELSAPCSTWGCLRCLRSVQVGFAPKTAQTSASGGSERSHAGNLSSPGRTTRADVAGCGQAAGTAGSPHQLRARRHEAGASTLILRPSAPAQARLCSQHSTACSSPRSAQPATCFAEK